MDTLRRAKATSERASESFAVSKTKFVRIWLLPHYYIEKGEKYGFKGKKIS